MSFQARVFNTASTLARVYEHLDYFGPLFDGDDFLDQRIQLVAGKIKNEGRISALRDFGALLDKLIVDKPLAIDLLGTVRKIQERVQIIIGLLQFANPSAFDEVRGACLQVMESSNPRSMAAIQPQYLVLNGLPNLMQIETSSRGAAAAAGPIIIDDSRGAVSGQRGLGGDESLNTNYFYLQQTFNNQPVSSVSQGAAALDDGFTQTFTMIEQGSSQGEMEKTCKGFYCGHCEYNNASRRTMFSHLRSQHFPSLMSLTSVSSYEISEIEEAFHSIINTEGKEFVTFTNKFILENSK